MNCRNVYIIIPVLMPLSAYSACPDGTTAYLGPESNRYRNANGDCVELCGAGITSLNTSNGYRFDLFATKNTTPAINVRHGDTVCYIDLISGQSDGTLNASYNDAIYHANPNSGQLCPASYTLSYSCGDGATGTPPESHEIGWGDMYTPPYDVGTCRRPGYSLSGWKIDSTTLSKGAYSVYNYTADKTMVAQWRANEYGGAYLCSVGPLSSSYITGTFGSSVSTSTSACTGVTEWSIVDNDCNVLDTVSAGSSFVWEYPNNIRLVSNRIEPYTLSYSCGEGATGTPPESREIGWGDMYTPPYDVGTCRKPGYSLSSWKIDSTTLSKGAYSVYNYTADKTMVAQWRANEYGGAYICDNGTTVSSYVNATFGNSITPSGTECTAADGATFAGYRVLDALGNDTGMVISPGSSWTWTVPGNIRLVALWE